MNKSDLISAVGESLELTHKEADAAVNTVFKVLANLLNEHGEVTVRGFGRFSVVESAPREARNLKTGEKILVPARKKLKMKSYLDVKEAKTAVGK